MIGIKKLKLIFAFLFFSFFNFIIGQPRSGDWIVPTEFGEFTFTVNEEATYISKIKTTYSDYSCGGITQNGSISSQVSPGWPISNNEFSLVQNITPTGSIKMTYNGIFDATGKSAIGDWECDINGIICSGSWEYLHKTYIETGEVSGVWEYSNSPYLVMGDITVPNDSTLIIEPGVSVEFQGHHRLNVQGRLLAVGTKQDSIIFTVNDTLGFAKPEISDGGWRGIRYSWTSQTNDSSKFEYCRIQYAKAIGDIPDNMGGAIFIDHFNKVRISNCTITNNFSESGGGIYLYYSSPKINDCTISKNIAKSGGGINCSDGSNPVINNNIIENNLADRGGGLVLFNSKSNLINTTIQNNNGVNDGGGILILNNSSITLKSVIINGNTSEWGGGIHCYNSDLIIDSSSFLENIGGAIKYDCSNITLNTYQLDIKSTVFAKNFDSNRYAGLYVTQENEARLNTYVDNCIFTENVARVNTSLSFQGKHHNFELSNSLFHGNRAIERAAGVMFDECTGKVFNCVLASNSVDTVGQFYNFGAIGVWDSANIEFMNCTIADNSGSYGAGLLVGNGGNAIITNTIFWGNSKDQIALYTLDEQGGTLTVNYCDIQEGMNSIKILDSLSTVNWGDNNIDKDPLFVDQNNGDYHLQNNSPCIGTAIDAIEINDILCTCPPFDIEGNLRPSPQSSMPDIGAYENELGVPTSIVDKSKNIEKSYSLEQNYPNPFNPSTTIIYKIPALVNSEWAIVNLVIFDVLGREVATLVNEKQKPGSYEVDWDPSADGLLKPSGVYFYQLHVGEYIKTKKMLLLK